MNEDEREQEIASLLRRPYRKVIRGDAEEGFLAEAPDLPGCQSAGETEIEALENLQEAMAAWFESALEHGDVVPRPSGPSGTFNGRVLVRMPKSLHRQLAERAAEEGVSLNQLAVAALARTVGAPGR